jgi:hypothetical protein
VWTGLEWLRIPWWIFMFHINRESLWAE